jgi:hypothetical protein
MFGAFNGGMLQVQVADIEWIQIMSGEEISLMVCLFILVFMFKMV